jgi:hypothetical protein
VSVDEQLGAKSRSVVIWDTFRLTFESLHAMTLSHRNAFVISSPIELRKWRAASPATEKRRLIVRKQHVILMRTTAEEERTIIQTLISLKSVIAYF